jgi:peptidoglycan hydrolase CwlO-like protein
MDHRDVDALRADERRLKQSTVQLEAKYRGLESDCVRLKATLRTERRTLRSYVERQRKIIEQTAAEIRRLRSELGQVDTRSPDINTSEGTNDTQQLLHTLAEEERALSASIAQLQQQPTASGVTEEPALAQVEYHRLENLGERARSAALHLASSLAQGTETLQVSSTRHGGNCSGY